MRFIQILGSIALVVGLSACAQNIKSDVARFHQLQSVSQGASFAVVPKNDEMIGSLEFQQYAGLVAAQMQRQGFQVASGPSQADLLVAFDYSVSDGDQVIRTRGAGLNSFGAFGFGGFNNFYGGFGPWGGGFGGAGMGADVYSYEVFTRGLTLQIYRAPGANAAEREVVFEGKVNSVGRDNRLPEVMPFLVEAMFVDFPGQSGVTKEVKIEVPRS